jgi:hypothetical protein
MDSDAAFAAMKKQILESERARNSLKQILLARYMRRCGRLDGSA